MSPAVPKKVLLVEDSFEFQALVKRSLTGSPCDVDSVTTLKEAADRLRDSRYDLILLDVMLPDGDGFQFCASLQATPGLRDVPIIFLTGKSDIRDKVTAFSLGAEDYVVKPFEPLELRARVESRLNRRAKPSAIEESLIKGELTLNVAVQKALIQGRELGLTPIEFKILYHLARHEGRAFSRAELLSSIWGDSIHVLEHNIYTHVYSLRRKLGSHADCIRSVPRLGYRFESG
jgi:two-component system phosphate regulon response regulator PhoB